MLGIAGLVHAHSWLSPYQNKTASFNQDMFLIKKKKKLSQGFPKRLSFLYHWLEICYIFIPIPETNLDLHEI